MLSQYKPKIKGVIDIISLPFLKLHPNVITIIGLVPSVLFLFCIWKGYYLLATICVITSVFDAIDGAVARKTGKVSAFGGVLDSTVDRLSDALIITGFGFGGIVRWEIVIPVLIASFLISYIRSRAELAGRGGFTLNVGLIERTERIIFFVITVAVHTLWTDKAWAGFQLPEWIFILLLTLSTITVLQRLLASKKRLAEHESKD